MTTATETKSSSGGPVVRVEPEMFRWAIRHSGKTSEYFTDRFGWLAGWEDGDVQPTMRQLEEFAEKADIPFGYMLFSKPPVEKLPVLDLRRPPQPPSGDLLDTSYACYIRQVWFHGYRAGYGEPPVAFVGSLSTATDPVDAAREIRPFFPRQLAATPQDRDSQSPAGTLKGLIDRAEHLGVLVMIDRYARDNPDRPLDPGEFTSLIFTDPHAPTVFLNGNVSDSELLFSFCCGLARVWLGQNGLTDTHLTDPPQQSSDPSEVWCRRVAGELLAPTTLLDQTPNITQLLPVSERLAEQLAVDSQIVLRQFFDTGRITEQEYLDAHSLQATVNLKTPNHTNISADSDSQSPERVQRRCGRRFSQAVCSSTLEGRTLYEDALSLLDIPTFETFDRVVEHLEQTGEL